MANIEEKFNAAIRQINAQRTASGSLSGRRNLSIEDKFNNAIRQITEKDNQERDRQANRLVSTAQQRREEGGGTPAIFNAAGASRPGSVTQQITSALGRMNDRGLIDTVTSSDSWDTTGEAETALKAWESQLDTLSSQVSQQERQLESAQRQLEQERESLDLNDADAVARFNQRVDEVNAQYGEYERVFNQFDTVRNRYESGIGTYHDMLIAEGGRAQNYRDEAERLAGETEQLAAELDRYRSGDVYYDAGGSGINTAQRREQLERQIEENESEIKRLRAEAERAQWAYYSGLALNEDYAERSAPLGSQREVQIAAGESPYEAGGAIYDYINNIGNAREIRGYDAAGNEMQALGTMTDEEIGLYNYIYATQGREAATEYLERLRETINARLGQQRYENMSGLGRALYWIPAGINQFTSGIRQLFSGEAVPTSPTQYTSQAILEGLEGRPVASTLYELGTTLSNMAPSILASVLGGWALGAAGVAGSTAGRIANLAGSALLGASAGGNAYTQKINEGYLPDEARDYSTLVGLSEGALQYVLGGIEGLGGEAVRGVAAKIGALDNALGRIARSKAGKLVMNMISEGTEEGVQELLEPAFAALILGEEYDANFEDAAYAFLLGALTAGIVEGAEIGVSGVYNAATRRSNPAQVSFADMDNYLGEDGRDWFEGAADRAALDRRFQELAESEEGESLSDAAWENITKQYNMARAFLDGRETAQNVRSGGAAQTVQEAQEAASAPQAAQAAEAAQAAQETTQTVQAEREAAQTVQPRAAELTPDGGIVLPDVDDGGGVILPDAEQLERNERAANAATELERSGILAGVSDEDIGTAQRLSNLLNRPVVFYDGAQESGAFGAANGYFADDTIHVNSRSNNPVAQIIAHELTHSIEGADSYSRLRQYTLGYLRERGEDIDALRARKRDIYARNGVQLDDAAIDQEIVAEFVEHYLLADEESIRRLVTRDRTLGQRILDWINRVLEWLGVSNRHTREYQLLKRARDAYARALRETESRRQRATAEQTLEGAGEDYVSGEISDEEFDASMDAVTEQESLAGTEQLDVTRETEPRYSFARRNAANADLEALDAAEEMERRGVDAETIRQQTGWFRGRDGKWRFEIDDSGMENVPGEYARMYRNTAGEIEARDAEARRRLTAEERRATPPDLGDENTVFADDEIPVKARFSLDEDYEREIDAWNEAGRPDGEVFILGRTGNVLQGLGASEQDIYLRSEKVNHIMQKHPEMTLAEIKRIPEVLDDPIIVAKSSGQSRGGQNTRLTMFGELFAQDGGPVMAVLDLRPVEDGIVINDMQKVNSAYHRNNELNYLRRSELLYVDENRAIPLLQTMGLQIRPTELQRYGSMGNISYNHQNVNIEGVPFNEVVRTEDTPQYSISEPERRRDVMAQLRRYVGGDITSAELNNYLNGQTRAVNEEAGAAQDIIDRAHADGMSVDEFLRYNWEEFETDGVLNEDAQRALDLERLGAARRYGVADPERVSVLPGNVEVVQNATPGEYRRMRNASYIDYPWLMETGDSPVAQLQGGDGNTYTWREDQMSDEDVGYYMDTALEPRFSIDEDAPAEAPDALTQEYNELVASLPNKARPFLRRAENQLLDAVSKAFGVPYAAKRDSLRPVVQEITLEYMLTGTVSTETVDELFERAYEAGIVINREYYDQYKDVLDYLKNTQLRVSQDIVGDIPDFEDFRKANFGRLRISTREGSSNVDQAFMEMAERWPELFDAQRYIVPSDQLLRISSVANGIRIAETSLDRALGRGAAEFREESRRELDALLGESIGALRNVRRSAADEAARRAENEGSAPNMPRSQQEAAALWQELKQLRRDFERVRARTLLTRADNEAISQLMSGQTTLQNLNPDEYNIEGIRAVYAAKRAYEDVAIQLRRWNQARRSRLYEQADGMLENSGEWKDKRAGALYSRETMERNIRDIVTDQADADAIIETYFKPVHEAAAEGNRIKNRYRDRVRELKLSRRVAEGNVVSEAHAVQLLGEAEDNIDFLLRSRGRVRERDGKSLEDWRGIVQNLWRENPKLDEAKIRGAVSEFRRIYDELFEQMNEVRVRNGYEPVNYRHGYFPHFQPGDGDGIISQFGRALGIDTKVTALPTSINGLTHAFRPGITWFGNAMERLGFNTAYDAVEGFDRYIEGVTDVITQTDNIQRLRALANRIRYNTTDEGMRAQIDQILNDPTLKEEDKQNRLKDLYEKGRFTLSNFVVDLEEYTNLLANKKSRRDRDVEQDVGRGIYNIMRTVSGRVAANMVAINPSSWLTNLVPLTQGWAQLGSGRLLKGMWETLRSYKEDDGIIDKSTFLTNRQGSDPIVRVWEQGAEPEGSVKRAVRTAGRVSGQLGEILSSPMQLIDMFVSGSLVRAKYQQNLGKGMSEEAAMADADQFAANVIADRSKGAQPTRFGRRNPLAQVFNQFQLEVNNQLSYIFKDVPRETRAAGVRALAMAMLKFFFGALLYNEAYELIFGRRPALDVFGLLNDTVGDIFGWEVPNLLELGWGLASGNVPSFETEAAGLLEAGFNFVGNAAEQLPFVGGIIGGGRLPISSALPDMYNLLNAALGEDLAPEYRRQEILDELNAPFSYVVMPFGGSIMNRIFDSVKAAINGGVYTYNSEGERLLQYPVYNEDAGDVAETILRGGMFGLTTYGTGREWVEEGFPTLTADQTAAYQGMIDAGVRGEDAYDLIGDIRDADSSAAKRYAITQADISGEGKSVAYYALLASDDERETMDELAGMGADMGAVTEAMIGVKNGRELEGPQETEMKLKAIREAELSQDGKYVLYRDLISENHEEDINAFLDAGLSFDSYLEAREQYARIEQDAESSEERAFRFAEWVESQSVTSEQAEVMRDTIAPLRGNIGKLAGAGMDLEAASEIDEAIDGLGEDASSTEKYMAIAELPISEAEKDMALEGIMSESAYAKYAAAREAGIDTYDYCVFLDHIAGISGDGRQERIWALIDGMALSRAQKDALHLAAGYKDTTLSKAPWNK